MFYDGYKAFMSSDKPFMLCLIVMESIVWRVKLYH